MSKYRINVRFDLDKPKEANAAQYLQSMDKSRNAFMITAVLNEMLKTKRACWMTWKCSAEPKHRYVAQIAVFAAEAEPLWRKDRMHPNG